MISEELEFRISQYADGSLPAEEVDALEAALASDAEARAMLADYRKLDTQLKRQFVLPAMNWERLAGHLSDAVAAADERAYASSPMRIGNWVRVAIAAMVVLAVGSAAWLGMRPAKSTDVAIKPTAHPALLAVAEVSGPRVETSKQPTVEEVAIGPSKSASGVNYAIAEDLVYRTPRVVIASSGSIGQDTSSLPY